MRRKSSYSACLLFVTVSVLNPLGADPLTQHLEIDFGRDVASRDLKGLATRSDGAIVPGPTLAELAGPALGELLWTLEPVGKNQWLVGTGPDGRIMEVTLTGAGYSARELVRLAEPQVFAVKALADGAFLAGTSPTGALYLIKDGKAAARVVLPADSIFDILLLPGDLPAKSTQDPEPKTQNPASLGTALVATGNPGRIYRIDLPEFARAGINDGKIEDAKALAAKGITLFGGILDRNIRRLAVLADGRIAAGSAPRGNIYLFPALIRTAGDPAANAPAGAEAPAKPATPIILEENRDAEVTDLLPQPNGDLFASVVFSAAPRESRINRPGAPPLPAPLAAPATPPVPAPVPPGAVGPTPERLPSEIRQPESPPERFLGRSKVVFFPAGGFPETLLSRSGVAFYRLARRGEVLVIAAGEQGEVLGWDLKNRLGLTFPGSVGSQLNGLAALPGGVDRYLLLRNNAPGLALLDFSAAGPRQLETKRLDLGVPAQLGKLRFDDLSAVTPEAIRIEARTSFGSDEAEGWTDWSGLKIRDGAYDAAELRGRYVKVKIMVPADARNFRIDAARLYQLPQDRPPVLVDFHLLPPNLELSPAPEARPPAVITLGQLLNPNQPPSNPDAGDPKRKNAFLGSQVVPSPGTQVATWTVTDADGDTLAYTFSIKRPDAPAWTDLAVDISENYVQFDTSSLPDGLYRTHLVATEQAPRPADQRLRKDFETDDLLVDHTPPEILDAAVRRVGTMLVVTVHGRDAVSLLDGAEFSFNNGYDGLVLHPVDGILDGREETFELQTPAQNVTGATAVEIHLEDQSGNTATRRLPLP